MQLRLRLRHALTRLSARGPLQVPVLLDVALGMSVTDPQVFPNPIPDLFVGSPVVISGSYRGVFPQSIVVAGRIPAAAADSARMIGGNAKLTQLADGMGLGYEATVTAVNTRVGCGRLHPAAQLAYGCADRASVVQTIPLDKVFTKQRLDLMIAADWLAGSDVKSQTRQQIVELSERTSVPCP